MATTTERTESLDAAFLRFRRKGELDALERVFRETASDLRQLALHLTRDVDAADDVVQTTFLTAIDDARSFRPGSRVMPWLVGILNNRVREHRRRTARGASTGGDEAFGALADHGDGPDRHAAIRELFAAARRGIEALAPPYREVVRLTVESGLLAKEIAERLGRPAGTVRAQVARGMEMLRRSLPASSLALFAFDVETLSGGGEAAVRLASIRERVLEHGARVGPKLAASGAVGVWGGGLLLVLGLVIAAVIADWILSGPGRVSDPGISPTGGTTASTTARTASADAASEGAEAPMVSRAAVASEDTPEGAIGLELSGPHLIARCVDATTGEAIGGVRVELVAIESEMGRVVTERSEVASGRDDGIVAVPLANVPREPSEVRDGTRRKMWRLEFDAGAPYASMSVELTSALADSSEDARHQFVGDLSFAPGVGLIVAIDGVSTLVGGDGASRRSVQLLPLDELSTGVSREPWRVRKAYPVVEPIPPGARFGLTTRLLPGNWLVGVEAAARVSPNRIEVLPGQDGRVVTIEVEDFVDLRSGPVRGIVVDATGRGIANAIVIGQDPDGGEAQACQPTTTALDGTFEITRVRSGLDRFVLRAVVDGSGIAASRTVDLADGGASFLRIELPVRSEAVRLEVVDADGAAVEDFAVRVHPYLREPPRAGEPIAIAMHGTPDPVDHAGPFESGVLELDALRIDAARRGRLEILPWPAKSRAVFAPTFVEVEDLLQRRALRVVLPRLVEDEIRVVDGQGDPVAGAVVELLRPIGAGLELGLEPDGWSSAVAFRHAVVRVGREVTGDDGVARLRVPEVALTVQVRAPGRETQIFAGVEATGGSSGSGPIELALGGAGAQIAGRLTGEAFGRWLVAAAVSENEQGWPAYPWTARRYPAVAAAVVWTPADVRSIARFDEVVSAPVADDGTFRIAVPAGARGRLWLRQIGLVARTGSARFGQADLGEIEAVTGGVTTDVAMDVDAHAFGILQVQVRAQARGGIDPERARASYGGKWIFDLQVEGVTDGADVQPSANLERGRARILLEPGLVETLSLHRMRVEEHGNGYGLFTTGIVDFALQDAIRIEPGETVDVEMPIRWGGLEATVRSVDGEPIAGETLELETSAGAINWVTTDEHGRLDLPFMAPGRAIVRRYEWTARERIERSSWAVDIVEGRTTSVDWVAR
jgi:RNA polymerase sigma-70 factor (ECF subfamily)